MLDLLLDPARRKPEMVQVLVVGQVAGLAMVAHDLVTLGYWLGPVPDHAPVPLRSKKIKLYNFLSTPNS